MKVVYAKASSEELKLLGAALLNAQQAAEAVEMILNSMEQLRDEPESPEQKDVDKEEG